MMTDDEKDEEAELVEKLNETITNVGLHLLFNKYFIKNLLYQIFFRFFKSLIDINLGLLLLYV